MATTPVISVDQRTNQGNQRSVDSDFPLPVSPTPGMLAAPNNARSTAYSNSLLVKATPGTLYGMAGYNSGPDQFIQLYDAVSLPANGVAPVVTFRVPAQNNFSIEFGPYGFRFDAGMVVGNSTTGPTKTIGAADTFFYGRYV